MTDAPLSLPASYVEFSWGQEMPPPFAFRGVRVRGFCLAAATRRLPFWLDCGFDITEAVVLDPTRSR
jgi:hypothetical protein